jgi:hypothetical protein
LNPVIVNYSTKRYLPGQRRLLASLTFPFLDSFGFTEGDLQDCPDHSQNPYAFKIYSIEELYKRGYTKILWLDASVWAVSHPQTIFDLIKQNGFFMEDSDHKVGQWSNTATLKYYGITRKEAMKMKMISSGFVGIDFDNETGRSIFEQWKQAMKDGMFAGSWKDHRHDQTCLSIINYKMGIENLISTVGQFFAYLGEPYAPPKPTAVFYLKGIC